ncbi:hypothetical protein [Nitrospirillum pindoramense]|uniref:Uncharacterized protein n=1 Tax=Nitrospirillum amazonense TaxID=28077 RepID=A0A560GUA6_9PROT|nr:hypothetical protein [Nitrospirillum amazonense]TWB37189.1 hypothetical protein FBZ90_1152 [Nitrospirillum amazonense]
MGNDPVSSRPIGGGVTKTTFTKTAPAGRSDGDFQKALARSAGADPSRASQTSSTPADAVRISQQSMLSGVAAYNMAAQALPATPGYQRPVVRVGDNVTTKNEKSDKGAFRLSPSRELQGRTAYAKVLQTQTAVSQAPNAQGGAAQSPAVPVTGTASSAPAADSSQVADDQGKVADRSTINIVL